jgi:hypothetical protein
MENTARVDETKELWDIYRIGKSYPCLSDITQHAMYHVVSRKLKKQYDLGEQALQREPKPGSLFYVETFDPPIWFQHALEHEQIILALQGGNGKKNKKKNRKGKTKSLILTHLYPENHNGNLISMESIRHIIIDGNKITTHRHPQKTEASYQGVQGR